MTDSTAPTATDRDQLTRFLIENAGVRGVRVHLQDTWQQIRERAEYPEAAAELLGVPTRPYHQKAYVTCLDLGDAGALFTRGWERKVEMVGDVAKRTKQEINTVWIYPPKAERAVALASADPERVTNL